MSFTINGAPQTAPYTESLPEGFYTPEMPQTYAGYVWDRWLEDGDANRIKTITLSSTTWTAVYTSAPTPPVSGKATPITLTINPESLAPYIALTVLLVVAVNCSLR